MPKIILPIFALLQLTSIYSQPVSNISDRLQQELQDEIFEAIFAHDALLWGQTPAEQNIQFVPLSADMCANAIQFKYYHDGLLYIYYGGTAIERSYALGNLVDTMQNSSNVKLKVNNALFYKREDSTENFLNDLRARYHSELYNTSFDPKDNETVLAQVNESVHSTNTYPTFFYSRIELKFKLRINSCFRWILKNTNGRGQKIENLSTSGKVLIHVSTLGFTGCWDKVKSSNSIKSLNFKTANAEIKVNALNAKEIVGYQNNVELKYEAIRIPFKNHEFAAIVVLPYPDQSLESLRTFENAQYRQLLEHFGNNGSETNVDYTIPILNSAMISFNVNGTSVNGDDFIACDSSSPNQQQNTSADYKRFYVDKPFGIFIYHEKTKIILVRTLVKNPTSVSTTLGTLEARGSPFFLKSGNLYEFLLA